MSWFPEPPELPLSQRASGSLRLRYEDVSQDGRLLAGAMPAGLGEVFWRPSERTGGLSYQLRGSGILPILSRLSCESLPGPISVNNPLTAHSRYELAQCREPSGEVARLLLRVWLDLRAPRAHTHGQPPQGAGEVVRAGRLFAEHVFTRPFAPPVERRVLALPMGVPSQRRPWLPPHGLLEATAAERPLADAAVNCGEVVFGRGHTDANQHVNSLVYPRLFYDAALRLLAPHVGPAQLVLTGSELAFRKPCFVGDARVIRLRSYQQRDGWSVRGVLSPIELAAVAPERANVLGRLLFERSG